MNIPKLNVGVCLRVIPSTACLCVSSVNVYRVHKYTS